ncbi:increased DNA methylation 1 [Morus notabilis]|uniref:increased DNA methylation 1 n=1 Tax=Morus notabilis TaxID=981085 RepID=UPI000CED7E66|nr:increased DNA methylation 1 [Morus notabilis]
MAYKLRDRNEDPLVYRERSSSDSESDSDGYDDPDYSNRPMRRQPRQQHQHIPGDVGMADHLNMNGTAGLVRRRSGRPPRNPAPAPAQNQAPNIAPIPERRRRRRRAPYSLRKLSNAPRFQEKKTILALLIDMGRVEDNQLVYYWDQVKRKVTLHGKISRAGIHCRCCEKVVTVSEFEDHARSGFKGEPYRNIALRDGTTLFVGQFVAWCKIMELSGWSLLNNDFEPKKNAMDKSDDACIVCADGGDLICCEKCPSTFHFSCLNMERIPQDDWLCAYCVCKHCGLSEGDTEISECTLCEKTCM